MVFFVFNMADEKYPHQVILKLRLKRWSVYSIGKLRTLFQWQLRQKNHVIREDNYKMDLGYLVVYLPNIPVSCHTRGRQPVTPHWYLIYFINILHRQEGLSKQCLTSTTFHIWSASTRLISISFTAEPCPRP